MRVWCWVAVGACTGEGPLGVNEVASHVTRGVTNEAGAPTDWIEILNRGREPRSLDGWALAFEGGSFAFPDRALAPGEMVLILCDGMVDVDPLSAPFTLPEDDYVLSVLDELGREVQQISVPTTPADHSFARVPDDSLSWQLIEFPTPGLPNATSQDAGDSSGL